MGADISTQRMKTLTDMGFTVTESRIALEETGGDVQRAADLLLQRRADREHAAGGVLAYRVNQLLREQRPWPEFFERFLWPEHLPERVQTNLVYYRANYAIICTAVLLAYVLLQPTLLIIFCLVCAMLFGAVEWGDTRPVPGLNQPLALDQRVAAAALASAAVVHMSGSVDRVARVALLCGGLTLGHATFRARSLAARWHHFKEQAEKVD